MNNESIAVARPSLLRHTNALIILKLMREIGSCSRADLVRASGLSAPTVTNVVGNLLSARLIKMLGEGESSGGRPPDMICFNADRGCLLAVEIKGSLISFLLTDLRGVQIDSTIVTLAGKATHPEAVCQFIRDELRSLIKRNKKQKDQLLALVVGVPAITDVELGVVVSISTLTNWRSVPLRAMLKKLVDCLVIVENDTNLAALGERYCGAAQSEETFISIIIGANVSAGIVLDGKIHHGAQWSAGEIAYLRLPDISRRYPALHEFGELETVLTSSGILKSFNEASSPANNSANKPLTRLRSVSAVLKLAESGDLRAMKIVQHRAEIVSDIVTNLSLILNPALILLGGEVGSHSVMLALVNRQLEKSEFGVTKIAAASLGDAASLWGGIAMALEEIPFVLLPLPV